MSDPNNPYGQDPNDPHGQQPPPYGQQPPNPYGGQPAYTGGTGGYVQNHPQSTTILVLGILSLICCGILGPVAWVMGNKAITQIDSSPGMYTGREQINIGRILGIIATALLVLGIVAWVLLIAFGTLTSSTFTTTVS